MSVVILGMEMPKVCITEGGWYHSCPMDRTWCAQRFAPKGLTNVQIFESQECKIPDWCPLRPLPEKHGRLIDEKELREAFGLGKDCAVCKQDIRDCQYNPIFTRMEFCGGIDDMKIIIVAEGET